MRDTILPGERAALIEEANNSLGGGRWEKAEKIYSRVIKDDPGESSANLGMGIIAYHQGRFEDAEKYFSLVSGETPGYEKIPPMLSRIYFQKQSPPDLNEITANLKENPEDCRALLSLAIVYARGGEYDRALNILLQVLKIKKEFEEGLAREVYIKILEILGRSSQEGNKYERELSMILFS